MRIKEIRRENLRQLAKEVGGITQLADTLDKSQSLISHLIGKRPTQGISDRFASAVEEAFAKPAGWLDRIQSLEFEGTTLALENMPGVFCRQVPLIDWKHILNYLGVEQALPKVFEKVTTTMKLSPLGFALRIESDSMESAKGISFAAGQIIVVEPQQKAKSEDYVIVQLEPHRGLTLKQWISYEGKQSLKPLNRRYPCLSFTPQTRIFGVVKQLVMDF